MHSTPAFAQHQLVRVPAHDISWFPSCARCAASALEQLCAQDTLVSNPSEGDSLLFAVAVCAPYSVLSGYKYKVKLTPGTQKKGKAAKQAASLFSAAAASPRERDLIVAMPLDDTVRALLPSVRGVAATT